MALASINQKLRPIKIALLVCPTDSKSLNKAIQINTFLWGGRYNFIVPVYKHLPSLLNDKPFNRLNSEQLVYGYLDNFNPDVVVKLGQANNVKLNLEQYRVISESDLWESIIKNGNPKFGIGFYELLNSFIERELKYERRHKLKLSVPIITGRKNKNFLKALTGELPLEIVSQLNKSWKSAIKYTSPKLQYSDYETIYASKDLNLFRITFSELERERNISLHIEYCLFVLNPAKNLDIIDFWNLRAMGIRVMPFPIDKISDTKTIKVAKKFILKNFKTHKNYRNEALSYPVTVMKSRSIKSDESKKIVDELHKGKKVEVLIQNWYPRMWDKWASDKDFVKYQNYYCGSEDVSISLGNFDTPVKVLSPIFVEPQYYLDHYKYANDFDLHVYDSKSTFAEVIPQSIKPYIRSMSTYDDSWKFSKQGITYLAKYEKERVFLNIPKSEDLLVEWLENNNINNITFSKSSEVSKMLIGKMDSLWEIGNIANTGVIKSIENIGARDFIIRSEIFNQLHTNGVTHQQKTIDWLVKINAIRFGFRIKCPICNVEKWYSLNELEYILECHNCLGKFDSSNDSQSYIPAYKAIGPFTNGNKAEGVYTVLLTQRFFNHTLDSSTTTLFGFQSDNEFEVDLCIFHRKKFQEKSYDLAFIECKTFKQFEQIDINRMKKIALKFPSSQIVFATLNKALSSKEKKLLKPFINWSRKIDPISHGPRNEVIILTEIELMAKYNVEEAWKLSDNKHKDFAKMLSRSWEPQLWDLTQQLYVDMKPWQDWLTDNYNKHKKDEKSK